MQVSHCWDLVALPRGVHLVEQAVDRAKNVDYLLMADFLTWALFLTQTLPSSCLH